MLAMHARAGLLCSPCRCARRAAMLAMHARAGLSHGRGSAAGVQVIAMPDSRYKAYCTSSDFIREHIFPGGHLPASAP